MTFTKSTKPNCQNNMNTWPSLRLAQFFPKSIQLCLWSMLYSVFNAYFLLSATGVKQVFSKSYLSLLTQMVIKKSPRRSFSARRRPNQLESWRNPPKSDSTNRRSVEPTNSHLSTVQPRGTNIILDQSNCQYPILVYLCATIYFLCTTI